MLSDIAVKITASASSGDDFVRMSLSCARSERFAVSRAPVTAMLAVRGKFSLI